MFPIAIIAAISGVTFTGQHSSRQGAHQMFRVLAGMLVAASVVVTGLTILSFTG